MYKHKTDKIMGRVVIIMNIVTLSHITCIRGKLDSEDLKYGEYRNSPLMIKNAQ